MMRVIFIMLKHWNIYIWASRYSMSLGQDCLFEQPMAEILREEKICQKWNSAIIYVFWKKLLIEFTEKKQGKWLQSIYCIYI